MNAIIKTLVSTATTPFSYLGSLVNPKKKDPPKEEKKEDKTEGGGGSGDAEKDAFEAAISNEKNYVTYNEHDIEVYFGERDALYQVRLTSKAIKDADVHINELQKFLQKNRELMAKAANNVYKGLRADIEANLAYNKQHDEIKKGDLKPEKGNEKEEAAFAEILENGPRHYCEWHEKYIRPSVQNAVLARANIDMLIPLIRMRGGEAEFQGMEADPIDVHIDSERERAAKQACAELEPKKEEEKSDAWTIQEFLTAAIIVIIIALVLKTFIP
jgi:hypothetical protein